MTEIKVVGVNREYGNRQLTIVPYKRYDGESIIDITLSDHVSKVIGEISAKSAEIEAAIRAARILADQK